MAIKGAVVEIAVHHKHRAFGVFGQPVLAGNLVTGCIELAEEVAGAVLGFGRSIHISELIVAQIAWAICWQGVSVSKFSGGKLSCRRWRLSLTAVGVVVVAVVMAPI